MKNKVLLLGGLCIDETLECTNLPKVGQDIMIHSKQTQLGGSCLNVATLLKRLNKEPLIYSAIGDKDYLDAFQLFTEESFDTTCLYREDGQTGSCTILVDETKERTFLTYRGIEGNFDEEHIPLELMEDVEWIYLSGIYLVYGLESQKIVPFLIRMIHQGKKIFFDLGSLVEQIEISLLKECVSLSSIIKGNDNEIKVLIDRLQLQHITNILDSTLRIIIRTMGKEGSITYLSENTLTVPSVDVSAIDTTGSGDAFVGAFIASMIDNLSIQECLEIATQYGSIATTYHGGRIPLNTKEA
ncbi:carbohydrate kinase family protein [Anaerorhabdus sp.]|uniref:carbohydrate kinase family protein n=1 Tax=Anaerorhabdus sp. TaxID=1872524 RepID=UPI002B217790|nr:carbohydrate kinase family protein [Anaerorhabdus sp.]MEA4876173.1 carbohydrate kinase family protein [Anaerorhabdus sp.]